MPVARYIADLLHDSISGASAGRERLIPIQRLNSVTSWSGRVCPPYRNHANPVMLSECETAPVLVYGNASLHSE